MGLSMCCCGGGAIDPSLELRVKDTLVFGGLLTGIFLIHSTHFFILLEEYLQ